MNAYPRLSDKAYEDQSQHYVEVVDMMAEEVAAMWSYYDGKRLNDSQVQELRQAINQVLAPLR